MDTGRYLASHRSKGTRGTLTGLASRCAMMNPDPNEPTPEEIELFKRVVWYDQEDGRLLFNTGDGTTIFEGKEAGRVWKRFEWYRRNQRPFR